MELVRLQKFMAECGVASRRGAEELIAAGRVKVNGIVAEIGDKIDPDKDVVLFGGKRLRATKKMHVYYALHKPRGYVTTMNDERGRKCIAELTRNLPERVYPIGRLDKDSEGLLLLTNDGEFANAMMHPRSHIAKTYQVTIPSEVTDAQIAALTNGVVLDGVKTAPAEVEVVKREENRTVLSIVLYEGRNRQIRRMCEFLKLKVARLKRVKYGSVDLDFLRLGGSRELTEAEVKGLFTLINKKDLEVAQGDNNKAKRKR